MSRIAANEFSGASAGTASVVGGMEPPPQPSMLMVAMRSRRITGGIEVTES
jgi:hypothetical protein